MLLLGASCGTFLKLPPTVDAGRADAGNNPGDGGVRPDAGISPVEACKTLNLNRCAYFIRCGLIEDAVSSLEACVREMEATWCGPMTWPPHVAIGALKFDAVKAETCATAFETWSCREYADLPDSCQTFLRPRAALGENCFDGFTECTEGVCRGAVCPRTCQARAFADEACTNDNECRSNLFCRLSPFSPSSGVCSVYGLADADCTADRECTTGLHCVGQKCRVLPGAQEPCLLGTCGDTSYCDDANLDGGICVTRKGETSLCSGDQCQPALVCDALDSRCVRRLLSSGDACLPSQQCPVGEVCIGGTARAAGMCGRPLDVGSSCATNIDCLEHLACLDDGDGGWACGNRVDAGTRCEDDRECFSSARCVNHACAELSLPTEACSDDQGCRWGLCRVNGDAGVCGSLLGAGLDCVVGEQCASGLCDNGTCIGRCLP
ncbi:MAG: Dickkopf N-terminal cysteine-rich domain-containing protein [Archangium sp.]